jgi:hypothetical protein
MYYKETSKIPRIKQNFKQSIPKGVDTIYTDILMKKKKVNNAYTVSAIPKIRSDITIPTQSRISLIQKAVHDRTQRVEVK